MPTKLDKMKKLWEAGNYRAALKMVAEWQRLGEHKAVIKSGWEAAWNSRFYRQLGKDPEVMYRNALQAVAERYALEFDLNKVEP